MEGHPPGTPIWVDLSTTDERASIAFYGGLFGWTVSAQAPVEWGRYRNFRDEGWTVAGLNPMGQVAVWSTYMRAADADATAERAVANGGSVTVGPLDVEDLGRIAVLHDPEGATFGLWQPRNHPGAEKFNAPVALCWNDLYSRDLDAAAAFYGAVFGWARNDMPMPDGGTYTVWELDGRGVAGAMAMGERFGDETPAHWMAWFAVANRDTAVELARALGATIHERGIEAPGVGRMAVIGDPQGAVFGVLEAETADE